MARVLMRKLLPFFQNLFSSVQLLWQNKIIALFPSRHSHFSRPIQKHIKACCMSLTNVHNLLLFIVFRNHDDDGLWWKGEKINGSGFHHKMHSSTRSFVSMRRLDCTIALSIHSSSMALYRYCEKAKNWKLLNEERKKFILRALDF